jgi:hypothetical protein
MIGMAKGGNSCRRKLVQCFADLGKVPDSPSTNSRTGKLEMWFVTAP